MQDNQNTHAWASKLVTQVKPKSTRGNIALLLSYASRIESKLNLFYISVLGELAWRSLVSLAATYETQEPTGQKLHALTEKPILYLLCDQPDYYYRLRVGLLNVTSYILMPSTSLTPKSQARK